MQWLQHYEINIGLIYIALSVIVAIIIWFEGQALKANEGKTPESKWFHYASVLDTAWFFVSMIVIYFGEFDSIIQTVPVAYAIYSLFGWYYGIKLITKEGIPDSVDDLTIPAAYTEYSQAFSAVFFLLCLFMFILSWFSIDITNMAQLFA